MRVSICVQTDGCRHEYGASESAQLVPTGSSNDPLRLTPSPDLWLCGVSICLPSTQNLSPIFPSSLPVPAQADSGIRPSLTLRLPQCARHSGFSGGGKSFSSRGTWGDF